MLVEGYHADNGRFSEREFREETKKSNQSMSFCAAGTHRQDGVVENCTKDYTLGARNVLLHAKRFFLDAITMLWLFSLLACVYRRKHFQLDEINKSPH